MSPVTVIALGGMFAAVGALTVATRQLAADGEPKVAVCHFGENRIHSGPKTLMIVSQDADRHVANHTAMNGHEGNDLLGPCNGDAGFNEEDVLTQAR